MEKHQYNLSEKLDHIAYMFNVRTKGKAYENFIVNAIYTKVNKPELIPVTQQYVKVKDENSNNKYYFIDLYFPQINLGIEIDEAHHNDEENQKNDEIREDYITSAIECEIERIPIYKKKDGQWQKRTYDDICGDIDKIVNKIKERIQNKGGIKWETNEERKKAVINKKEFDITDNVYYRTIQEILDICKNKTKRQRCCGHVLNNEAYYLWVPKLTVDNNTNNNFDNFLSDDGLQITEINKNEDFKVPEKHPIRVVFMRTKDIFGKDAIKFVGVFKLEKNINSRERIFKRKETKYKF